MNIVHVFPYNPLVSGGHSNAIRSFIECQSATGLHAVGIAPKPDSAVPARVWEFPLAEVDALWSVRWETLGKRFGIQAAESLVHFHSVSRRFGPWLRDLGRAGVPYVFTSHGQLGFRSAAHWFQKFVYLQLVNRGLMKAAGLHLLTSLAERKLKFLLPGYEGVRLVQGNLVKPPDLEALAAACRSDYGIPEDAFVLLFLGRLDPRVKGLDLVVEAFSRLPPERFRLVLAGPDWHGGRRELEQLTKRLGCEGRVRFPGPVYGDQKWALLRMADLFVSPSRWEAFSVAHAEALAAGLPLLTSTQVCVAPDLREAKAALLVPLGAEPLARAIASVEADAELRQALARRGKAWAERHCAPAGAGVRFQQFYQSILERQHWVNGSGRSAASVHRVPRLSPSRSPFIVTPRLALEFIRRKRHARIRRRAEEGLSPQWFLLVGEAAKESLLQPQPASLRRLYPPAHLSWADPFLWRHGGHFFIFFEEWLAGDPYAHIAVLPLSGNADPAASAQTVLAEPYHLSYPFLFEYEGVLHMLPEAGAGRAINVYQCEEFPGRWRKRATLLRDLLWADATLFEYQAKWWLFLTIKRQMFALNRDLFVFWADSPLSDKWRAHPCNPVVRSLESARPSGPLFELEGRLFRPSQNCLVRYGHRLRINEIVRLDTKRYEERLVTEVAPDWEAGILGNHHIEWRDGLLVMDAQRLLPASDPSARRSEMAQQPG